MSAEKYAQFIAEQQKKLSVSGTNPVNLEEGRTGDWNKGIKAAEKNAAKHLTPAAKAARDKAHGEDDDGWYAHKEIHGSNAVSKEDWKKGIRKTQKEEAEALEERERSKLYIGSVDRDDPDYDKKVSDLKSKANKGGTRVRGRLGKDNPNAEKYRRGGPLYRSSSQDYKPSDSKSVDVYSRKYKKEEVEQVTELSKAKIGKYINHASSDKSMLAHEIGGINQAAATVGTTKGERDQRDYMNKQHGNRSRGIGNAVNKLTGQAKVNAKEEVEQIDEISSGLARSYIKKAKESESKARADLYKHSWLDMKDKRNGEGLPPESAKAAHADLKKANKRESGISLAKGKLTGDQYKKWEKPKGKRNITQVTKDTKVLTKEDAAFISIEESAYLEEMVGRGKLPDILKHHSDNMKHHLKMKQHHIAMADKSEAMGDHASWDHHITLAQQHDADATHHSVRVDHASSLSAKAKAHKDLKSAQEKMKSANKALMAAKANKEDWG